MDEDLDGMTREALIAGPHPAVPEWPRLMRGCIRYRQSLDARLPGAPRSRGEAEG